MQHKILSRSSLFWHKIFFQSLIAGMAVAFITLLFEYSLPEILLFSSVAGSSLILAHEGTHHLSKLHTILSSYIFAGLSVIFVTLLRNFVNLSQTIAIFLVIFLSCYLVLLFDVVHPPAISAAFSFFYFEMTVLDLSCLFLFLALLFIAIRLLTYLFSHHLTTKAFYEEFVKTVR